MIKSKSNPKLDAYFNESREWPKELAKLRAIILGCGLVEELKWGKPCYTFEGNNLIILYRLKESCAVGFLKGTLLKDSQGILIAPGENSQSNRYAKFTSVREIAEKEAVLKAYIRETIDAEKAGLKVQFKEITEHQVPAELEQKWKANPALKKAFRSLTPGRQRGYLLYFSGAKQPATREARIDKCTPQILKGRGLHD
jgi:uncharacterized protein YdeI (YjbR/CyaY-like superfamily)